MGRKTVFRTVRQVHAYAGVVLCALLLVLSLTGSLLVFKDEYIRVTLPEAREMPDLSTEGMAQVSAAAEQAFVGQGLSALVFATPEMGLHKVYLTEGRAAYLDREGNVVAAWDKNGRVEDWLFDLHHHLLAGEVGEKIAGVAGLAAALMVMTGLVAYWPSRRGFRRGLKISSSQRSELLSVHRNLGLYSAAPLLVIVLTGAAMAFPQTSRGLFDGFGGAIETPSPEVSAGQVDWETAFPQAGTAFPKAVPRIVIWPRSEGPAVIRLRQPGEWHPNGRTVAAIDPATSQLVGREDAMTQGAGRRAYNAVYPIHAAHVGGMMYDLVVFLAGLALSSLSLLGITAFLKRRRV